MKKVTSEIVSQLLSIPENIRPALLSESHDTLAENVKALDLIEAHLPGVGRPFTKLRVAAWNLERCKYPEASAALLAQTGAEICLLSEMDYGMARSGNRHTTRDLAKTLSSQFIFGVEFVELGIGSPTEEVAFQGGINSTGYHGNAIVSPLNISEPVMIRLDDGGAWFSLEWHHPRLGGRNALAATFGDDANTFVAVSIHLENLETPNGRARQVERMLDHLKLHEKMPVIIAGDFNTAGLPECEAGNEMPDWFIQPEKYEPLFSVMKAAGFEWISSNTSEQTRRILDDGRPRPAKKRLDWFFVKGLRASNPKTWSAADQEGGPISDHELITVDIEFGSSAE